MCLAEQAATQSEASQDVGGDGDDLDELLGDTPAQSGGNLDLDELLDSVWIPAPSHNPLPLLLWPCAQSKEPGDRWTGPWLGFP